MSFWLNQVNSVLNKLDDRVETVAEETPDVVTTAASRARQILAARNHSSDEYSSYDDEFYNDDGDDDETYSDEQISDEELYSTGNASAENENIEDKLETDEGAEEDHIPESGKIQTTEHFGEDFAGGTDESGEISDVEQKLQVSCIEEQSAAVCFSQVEKYSETMQTQREKQAQDGLYSKSGNIISSDSVVVMEKSGEDLPPSEDVQSADFLPLEIFSTRIESEPTSSAQPPRAPISTDSASQHPRRPELKYQQIKESLKEQREVNAETKASLAEAQSEVIKLKKKNDFLEQQLKAAQVEMQAQMDELHQAAVTMERERADTKMEREELLEEQEEELHKCKQYYESQLEGQKIQYERRLREMEQRLAKEEETRELEHGENTIELEQALSRGKEALQKIIDLHAEKSSLESTVTKLELHQEYLQKQLTSLKETAETASKSQEQAEEKLDAALTAHQRQMQQRQIREAQLEKTITDLGAALMVAQEEAASASSTAFSSDAAEMESTKAELASYKEQCNFMTEEMDALKTQLAITQSRCNALQHELQEMSKDRASEITSSQNQLREYDEKFKKLTAANNRLEATVREMSSHNTDDAVESRNRPQPTPGDSTAADARIRHLTTDLEQAKRQISSLSDQLIRQQGISEQFKSEILALKGRLQAAINRADAAEQKQQLLSAEHSAVGSSSGGFPEIEMGNYSGLKSRRRVKGGQNRFSQLPSRSMRNAVGLRQTHYPGIQQQLAKTIDAVDVWMLETGGILRHEPLARLGFGLYMLILHIWCFALVAFHTVEVEKHEIKQIPMRGPLHPAHGS